MESEAENAVTYACCYAVTANRPVHVEMEEPPNNPSNCGHRNSLDLRIGPIEGVIADCTHSHRMASDSSSHRAVVAEAVDRKDQDKADRIRVRSDQQDIEARVRIDSRIYRGIQPAEASVGALDCHKEPYRRNFWGTP